MSGMQQGGDGLGVLDQRVGAGPAAARRALAEAALVVGIGDDAGLGPDFGRLLEGIAVVAEAVQAQDNGLGPASWAGQTASGNTVPSAAT